LLDPLVIFASGCVGALAPEIIAAYRNRKTKYNTSKTRILIAVSFFVLGGIVALALEADSLFKALFDGAAAPVLLSALAGQTPPSPPSGLTNSINNLESTLKRLEDRFGSQPVPGEIGEVRQELNNLLLMSQVPATLSARQTIWIATGSAAPKAREQSTSAGSSG